MQIETLTSAHAQALNDLMLSALKDYPTSFTTDFRTVSDRPVERVAEHLSALERSDGFRLGAFDAGGVLVGTVRLERRSGPKNAHCADVMAMFVRTQNQNQGAGRLLLEDLIEKAKNIAGLEQLELAVSQDAPAALHLYSTVGFERTGTLRRQIKVGKTYHDLFSMWMLLG